MKLNRWLIYQKERFPLIQYGAIVAAFSYSGLCVSRMMRGADGLPDIWAFVAAYLCSLILFFQLRVADEFKDHEEDCRYQPERPVPRGLVKLKELAVLGLLGAAVQTALAFTYQQSLLLPLLLTWLYFALMSVEFFVGDWLKQRPFTYLWTHMMILLFVDIFITAFDWMKGTTLPPSGLWLFLAVSFFNGVIIEIGRKIKSIDEEKPGVTSYTSAWGRRPAVFAWLAAITISGCLAIATATKLGFALPIITLTAVLIACAGWIVFKFVKYPSTGKHFESFSGLWTLITYLALGTVPSMISTFAKTL
jgi:4-hydroxybenzoate polyprenyltransferase